jgi:hypothetical protein
MDFLSIVEAITLSDPRDSFEELNKNRMMKRQFLAKQGLVAVGAELKG